VGLQALERSDLSFFICVHHRASLFHGVEAIERESA